MKTYPIIEKDIRRGVPIYVFDKLDGSHIRAEWGRKKKGFWKFGTKKCLLDQSSEIVGEAIALIKAKYERDLNNIFLKNRFIKAICFFEFWGPNSHFGRHTNEEHDVTLFDIEDLRKGILPPRDYLKLVDGKVDIAKLLYRGNANADFIKEVKEGTLPEMTFEGVVCKGKRERPGLPLMFKIKTIAWIELLRKYCKGDAKLFEELL